MREHMLAERWWLMLTVLNNLEAFAKHLLEYHCNPSGLTYGVQNLPHQI
jgi:hypothetical protein